MQPLFFFFLLVALAILAGIFILYPLFFRKNSQGNISQASVNLEAYQLRLQELEQDMQRGLLNQEQYTAAKLDLDAQLLTDIPASSSKASELSQKKLREQRPWLSGILLLLFTLGGSFFWYQQSGSWQGAQAETARQQAVAAAAPDLPEDFVKAMASLQKRLQQGTGEWQEWLILAQSYTLAERFAEARRAYASAYQLRDGRLPASAVVAYVEVLLLTDSDPSLPAQLLENLLTDEPENLEALWFAGLVAMQQGQLPDSLRFWYQLVSLEPRLQESPEISGLMQEAEQVIGSAMTENLRKSYLKLPQDSEDIEKTEETGQAVQLVVHIALSAEAEASISGTETVFVLAQLPEGGPPLAALRLPISALPTTVTLDDSQAMLPNMKLSNFSDVKVSARLSESGQATAQSGDWQGSAGVVPVNRDSRINIVIDNLLP